MLTMADIKVLPILPSESSIPRLIFTILTSSQSSLIAFAFDKIVFFLNFASIVLVIIADVNESLSYKSLYENPNWISFVDLAIYLTFLYIFMVKLGTSKYQAASQLEVPDYLQRCLGNSDSSINKILTFILTPSETTEFFVLILYGTLFWPLNGVIEKIEILFYLSFYIRCIKMSLYSRGWRTFFKILYRGRQAMIELFFLVGVLLLILGFSAYLAERFLAPANDLYNVKSSREFNNMLDGIWWAVVTITSTGYGDYYTVTSVGRLISTVTMITGFLYIAMPISIINNFYERYLIEEDAKTQNWRNKMHSKIKKQIAATKGVASHPIQKLFQDETIPSDKDSELSPPEQEENSTKQILKKNKGQYGLEEFEFRRHDRVNCITNLLRDTEILILKQKETTKQLNGIKACLEILRRKERNV